MFKLLNKKKNNKGFTLVELVIVVAILAILVGILAPQYTKYVEKSRKSADASNLENLVTAFKTAASDGSDTIKAGTYTFTINGTETTLKVKDGEDTTAAGESIEDVITSFAGENWKTTKLKSARWEDENGKTVTEISAELTVKNDGSVTVKYTPSSIKNQTNS